MMIRLMLILMFSCVKLGEHLRASEAKKRPAVDFMETVQQAQEITPSMRAILIDWLVDVAEEYKLVPDTLYLTVNYIDRYLSGNPTHRLRFQLLGVTCIKYEGTRFDVPEVEDYCYITDHTFSKYEVLQMESSVLNFLKFEMTAPTVTCFLGLILGAVPAAAAAAAQGDNMAHPMKLYYLASYICELSLLEYNMLCYAPSLIAASAIFLARFVLNASQKPWSSYLTHFTRYQPSDLQECVKALHALLVCDPNSKLPAIRNKFSQHRYKCVAEITCPSSIPLENLDNNVRSSLDGQPASRDGHGTIPVTYRYRSRRYRSRKSSKTNTCPNPEMVFGTTVRYTGISQRYPGTVPVRTTKNGSRSRSRMGLGISIRGIFCSCLPAK